MDDAAWNAHFVRTFGMRLSGRELHQQDEHGTPMTGDTLYVAFNAHHERVRFILPRHDPGERWERIVEDVRALGAGIDVLAHLLRPTHHDGPYR